MPLADLGAVKLAYGMAGDGPPLLMIMGLASTRHHWYGLDQALSPIATTIAFDNRCTGESSGPLATSLAQMADDAVRLLDRLGIAQASVIGMSMGGMIAQRLALDHPDRVARLVLGCTHHGGASQVWPARSVVAKITSRAGSPSDITRAFLSVCFSSDFVMREPDAYEQMVAHGVTNPFPPGVLVSQLGAIMGHDTARELGRLTARTLVIAGDRDELIPPANSRLLTSLLPNAELVLVPGAGHVFWVEARQRTLAALSHFIATGSALDAEGSSGHIRTSV